MLFRSMKAIAAPVSITTSKASTGSFTVTNRQFFKDLADFECFWSINRGGEVVDSGKVVLPRIAPQKSAKISIKSKALLKPDAAGERFINFSILRKNRTDWSPAGYEVGWNQFALPSRKEIIKPVKTNHLFEIAVDDAGEIQIPFGVFAPELSLWRAPTDNDRIAHISTKWEQYGVRELERTDCTITESAKSYKVVSEWTTSTGLKVKQVQLITPVADGYTVKETITVPKQCEDLARVGINFEIDGALSNYTYFGTGPNETYPDRKIGRVHKWISTVADQYVPYIRPQENGGHAGVRWFSLTDNAGHGIRIDLDKPLQVSATPFRAAQLADATHDVELSKFATNAIHIQDGKIVQINQKSPQKVKDAYGWKFEGKIKSPKVFASYKKNRNISVAKNIESFRKQFDLSKKNPRYFDPDIDTLDEITITEYFSMLNLHIPETLKSRGTKRIGQFSGGERNFIYLFTLLAAQPIEAFLLYPNLNLDSNNAEIIRSMIFELAASGSKLTILE